MQSTLSMRSKSTKPRRRSRHSAAAPTPTLARTAHSIRTLQRGADVRTAMPTTTCRQMPEPIGLGESLGVSKQTQGARCAVTVLARFGKSMTMHRLKKIP